MVTSQNSLLAGAATVGGLVVICLVITAIVIVVDDSTRVGSAVYEEASQVYTYSFSTVDTVSSCSLYDNTTGVWAVGNSQTVNQAGTYAGSITDFVGNTDADYVWNVVCTTDYGLQFSAPANYSLKVRGI